MAIKPYKSRRDGRTYYRFDWTDHTGKRHRLGKFTRASECETALLVLKNKIHNRRHGVTPATEPAVPPVVTVAQLVAARIRQRTADGFTRPNERHNLNRFVALLPEKLKVIDLAPAHISKFQEERLKRVKPQTLWREITDVYSMFRSAADLYPVLKGWTPPPRPRLKVPSGQRTRVLTRDEAAQIIAYLRRPREHCAGQHGGGERHEYDEGYVARLDAADCLQIALQSAARLSEIRLLKWTDFNEHFSTLTRRQWKKSAEPLAVPVSPALVSHLRARRARQRGAGVESEWMFPSSRDARRPRAHFETRHWKAACKACEIPYGRFTDGGLTFHDSRHTLVTSLLDAGVDIATVQSITGHSSKTMLMRYSHATAASRRRAIEHIADFGEPANVELQTKSVVKSVE